VNLATFLKKQLAQSPYRSVAALSRATRGQVSPSYLRDILSGRKTRPSYGVLMALAAALKLSGEETGRLLQLAGFAPRQTDEDTLARRILDAIEDYRRAAGPTLILNALAEGFIAALEAVVQSNRRQAMDVLLGEFLTAPREANPLDRLFASLTEAAGGNRWEMKRRIAEALPQLAALRPAEALQLARILRDDYHPDYRADIRRRVVEAVPGLLQHYPKEALALLHPRPGDEIYIFLAGVEILYTLQEEGRITAEMRQEYLPPLLQASQKPEDRDALAYLTRLLDAAATDPDAALTGLESVRHSDSRLLKICALRVAPRLLPSRPQPVLALMQHFLRTEKGRPVEHQNIRRPISKAAADIIRIMPRHPRPAARILHALAADPDVHVRRALSDVLEQLAQTDTETAMSILNTFMQDEDEYVRQRAWRTLLNVAPPEGGLPA